MADKTRPHFTAFIGPQRLATGPLAEVAIAVMQASRRPAAPPIIIFATPPASRSISTFAAPNAKSLPACLNPPRLRMSKPRRRRQRSRVGADGPSSALSLAR